MALSPPTAALETGGPAMGTARRYPDKAAYQICGAKVGFGKIWPDAQAPSQQCLVGSGHRLAAQLTVMLFSRTILPHALTSASTTAVNSLLGLPAGSNPIS